MRRLDIIVPVYRNADLTRACVESLVACRNEIAERRPRVLLVNDSPDDEAVDALLHDSARRHPEVHLLRNETNLGFVKTVNRGLRQARDDGHDALLVNSDTVTFAGTLRALVACAATDPKIGFVSPRSNNASICTLPHLESDRGTAPAAAYDRWARLAPLMPRFHFAPTAVGFYLFIAHGVLADVGALREEFGTGYEEENDLIMRAGKLGFRAVLANHAFVHHAGTASFALTGVDLTAQRQRNLQTLVACHPEFLPLMARYEASAHFRAERLLSGLLPDAAGRQKLVVDFTCIGQWRAGDRELLVMTVGALVKRHAVRLRVAVVCTAPAFEAHGLSALPGIEREEPGAAGLHGVEIRWAYGPRPDETPASTLLAPVVALAVRDTSVEDCGPIAAGDGAVRADGALHHADGYVFLGQSARRAFCQRHPAAASRPHFTGLPVLPGPDTGRSAGPGADAHVLVWGHGSPEDGADAAATMLAAAHPALRFVAIADRTSHLGNLRHLAEGDLTQERIDALFAEARLVVVPAYLDTDPIALAHALHAGRPLLVRRNEPTTEWLAALGNPVGVATFDHDLDLTDAFRAALDLPGFVEPPHRTERWHAWVDGLAAFCLQLARDENGFARLVDRIDHIDRAVPPVRPTGHSTGEVPPAATEAMPASDVEALLALDGADFVGCAYATLLRRPADAAGLMFYCGQLRDGVDKLDVLRALAISPEGRTRDVKLLGLQDRLAARTHPLKRLFKRWRGR